MYDLFVLYLGNVEVSLCIQGMLYGFVYFFFVIFQELSMHISVCRRPVCGYFTELVDIEYISIMQDLYGLIWCLCDCVLWEMEELILCKNLGVWDYVYTGGVALHVYLGHRVYGAMLAYL